MARRREIGWADKVIRRKVDNIKFYSDWPLIRGFGLGAVLAGWLAGWNTEDKLFKEHQYRISSQRNRTEKGREIGEKNQMDCLCNWDTKRLITEVHGQSILHSQSVIVIAEPVMVREIRGPGKKTRIECEIKCWTSITKVMGPFTLHQWKNTRTRTGCGVRLVRG